MLVSFKWLKEFVEIDDNPIEFGDKMTMSGTKVETITPVSETVEGIVAGKINKIDQHPDADRLVVCTVDIGQPETLTIVTSATNVFEGAVVPIAVIGSRIADGTKMKKAKFRGIESFGMFCSVEELGMDTTLFSDEIKNGIYILPEETAIGTDMKSLVWVDDTIIDFELTANRADCQSIYGIAREAAATLNKPILPIALYQDSAAKTDQTIDDFLSVSVENEELCSRYTAKLLKVKKIEASPLWMQVKLLNSGVRPINNIVDVTNYVMLEMGQPLHAFDYDSLKSKELVVKTTEKDKTVVTLDGQKRPIDNTILMITNGTYPVAIAGIMGGENSEIKDATEYVVLESACFDKTSVRRSAKKMGLRTEASARFEKGISPELAEKASRRATALLLEIGACDVIDGFIDLHKALPAPVEIEINPTWINQFIGIDLSAKEMMDILNRLFLKTTLISEDKINVEIPAYRQDLVIREDIAEEIARIYGYNNIPSTIMGGTTLIGGKTIEQSYESLMTELLMSCGYNQTLTTSFTGKTAIEALNMGIEDQELVKIMNPLGEDSAIMRPTLIGEQLNIINLNYNRKNSKGRFFEIANTYHVNDDPAELPHQVKKMVISGYGDMDYFDIKGVVELLLKQSHITDARFLLEGPDLFHPGRKATIKVEDTIVGVIGEIHPLVVKAVSLPKRTYVCELNMDVLQELKSSDIKFVELPKFPGSSRDIAVVLDQAIPAEDIERTILSHNTGIIENVELFDIYTGEQVDPGKKSLAYSISFRRSDRTLKEDDISPVMDAILSDLAEQYHAQLRD